MLDALTQAHDRGIVHRDLKPGNILINEEPQPDGSTEEVVKILDFGIAKLIQDEAEEDNAPTLTQAGTVLGTPHYMSPESIVGDNVDHTVDLYALGVIIYEMLTGRRPFTAKNSPSVMVRHLRDDPPPLPQHLEDSCWGEVVRDCLEKQPQFRPQTADDIRTALERRDEHDAPDWWKDAAPTEQLAHLETMQRERAETTQQTADDQASGLPRRAVGAILAGILVGAVVAVAFWLGRDAGSPLADRLSPTASEAARESESETEQLPDLDDRPSLGSADDQQLAEESTPTEANAADVGTREATADDEMNFDSVENDASAHGEAPRSEGVREERAPKKKANSDSPRSRKSTSNRGSRPTKVTIQLRSTPKEARVRVDGRPRWHDPHRAGIGAIVRQGRSRVFAYRLPAPDEASHTRRRPRCRRTSQKGAPQADSLGD